MLSCKNDSLLDRFFNANLLIFSWFSRLVAGAYTIKYREVGYPGFEPRPLHKLCNFPTN